jgi:hypothetical protein
MEAMTQVCAVGSPVVASQIDGSFDNLTDLYVAEGRIGHRPLSSACYTWHEILAMAASELWGRGEADAARVTL